MTRNGTLSAREAAKELGVSLETLYAYVSRGQVRSEPGATGTRARRYSAEDVARLKARKEQRREPELAAQGALDWGSPVLESQLTLIAGGKLYYRGLDAVELAGSRSFEEVAALLWTGDFGAAPRLFEPGAAAHAVPDEVDSRVTSSGLISRLQIALALASEADPAAWDLRPEPVAAAGARILHTLASALVPSTVNEPALAARLALGWQRPEAEELISMALVLCADHELNVSSFTARCIASAGSPPYAVVAGGLAALQGHRHGGHTQRVAALMQEATGLPQPGDALAARLRRGEPIPGFGHPLYPDGDVRSRVLLDRAASEFPGSEAVRIAGEVAEAGGKLLGEAPNLDFGLVTLCRAAGFPEEAPLALFALGRTAGWIGHAIEQSATGRLIRPRARYVGPAPVSTD